MKWVIHTYARIWYEIIYVYIIYMIYVYIYFIVVSQCMAIHHKPSAYPSQVAYLTGDCCNIAYPSETHLKCKSHEISFVHTLLISFFIRLQIA